MLILIRETLLESRAAISLAKNDRSLRKKIMDTENCTDRSEIEVDRDIW